jgi:hypothetical protein
MRFNLEYDAEVIRLNSATVAALALTLCFLTGVATAQINGTPASVTSTNFGGHANSTPGVPASITSLGPSGIQPRNPFPNPPCCNNPIFPVNPRPPANGGHHHRHQSGQFFPGGGAVYVPYAYPVDGEFDVQTDSSQPQDPEEYRGGPTIFDRRGPGTPATRPDVDAYPPRSSVTRTEAEAAPPPQPEEAVADLPQIVLIFKDGHQLEVQNYAVIGDTLYDLTPGRHHKIPLADLNLASTAKQNDDRGVDFRLPPQSETKK